MNFRKNKILIILLAVIIAGGFLRVYNFAEFLRFNPDQARDAKLVRDVLAGQEDWPLLGPQAGGTNFKLGPAFYQIQITAGKILGTGPDKLAYPDLLFSILTVPLLYLFLRKLFSQKITLAAVIIFAVSFYAIKYARFAWNPNSIPFYVLLFLYGLEEIPYAEGRKRWLWALAIGAVAGIGIQLHSLLLFTLPIVLIAYFVFLFLKKKKAWRLAPVVILAALIINIPQIANELKTGGDNTQAFFKGLDNKSSREGSLAYKLALDAVCHVQVNSFMLLPLGSNSECDFIRAGEKLPQDKVLIAQMIFAALFSLGGNYLMIRAWKSEAGERRKNFLGLIILYAGILFVILIPLAAEISFRFFLVLEFMPFLLLAFWFRFLEEKFSGKETAAMAAIVAFLAAANFFAISRHFSYLEGNAKEGQNGFEEITLGEVRFLSEHIISNSRGADNVYLEGKASELFKITKPVKYFTDEAGIAVKELKKGELVGTGDKLFLVDVIKNPASGGELSESNRAKYEVLSEEKYRRIRVYQLEGK